MTQTEKAEAVLAAFRDEVQCWNCHEDTPRRAAESRWFTDGLRFVPMCPPCACCNACRMRRRGISEMRCQA